MPSKKEKKGEKKKEKTSHFSLKKENYKEINVGNTFFQLCGKKIRRIIIIR